MTYEDRLPCPRIIVIKWNMWVSFTYLGSLTADSSGSHEMVDRRIASASKAFGGIEKSCASRTIPW